MDLEGLLKKGRGSFIKDNSRRGNCQKAESNIKMDDGTKASCKMG